MFFKPPTTIANPGEVIPVPRCAQDNEVDYEVELAIVLGQECKNVSPSEALGYVLGWTCANDLTARRVQQTSSQWGYSKGACGGSDCGTPNTLQALTSSSLSARVSCRALSFLIRGMLYSRLGSTGSLCRAAPRVT